MFTILLLIILIIAPVFALDPVLPPIENTKEASVATNTTKVKRDLYVCGVEPLIFRSEIPCQMYSLCANGGSRLNQQCRSTLDCSNLGNDVTCIDAVCCKRPILMGIPTSTQRFYNNAPTSLNYLVSLTVTFLLVI